MNAIDLIQLAEEFGLPCIERDGLIFIIGLEEIIEFKVILGEYHENFR